MTFEIVLEITLGIILMVLATVVAVLILMQSGKEKSLSGTIAGAGESFFSKTKGKTKERALSLVTTILSILFVILAVAFVVVIAIHQPVDNAAFFMGK